GEDPPKLLLLVAFNIIKDVHRKKLNGLAIEDYYNFTISAFSSSIIQLINFSVSPQAEIRMALSLQK
ncbi:hypothetical protein ACJX0J_009290, partial [Zea mays]